MNDTTAVTRNEQASRKDAATRTEAVIKATTGRLIAVYRRAHPRSENYKGNGG